MRIAHCIANRFVAMGISNHFTYRHGNLYARAILLMPGPVAAESERPTRDRLRAGGRGNSPYERRSYRGAVLQSPLDKEKLNRVQQFLFVRTEHLEADCRHNECISHRTIAACRCGAELHRADKGQAALAGI